MLEPILGEAAFFVRVVGSLPCHVRGPGPCYSISTANMASVSSLGAVKRIVSPWFEKEIGRSVANWTIRFTR